MIGRLYDKAEELEGWLYEFREYRRDVPESHRVKFLEKSLREFVEMFDEFKNNNDQTKEKENDEDEN